ncbi:MAG: (2Fe-2S)-binding protein, partial [Chloroflexota bacterium]|nr:(2Fe-2S)-binding protein [Chloroflexota bacterium]
MVQITVEGESTFDCARGRRLVLCIEDAGIDILHRCGGNARCTT